MKISRWYEVYNMFSGKKNRTSVYSKIILYIIVIATLSIYPIYARQGDNGYEGGISSGEGAGKTDFEYKEVCFLTGEPIVLTGILTLKKTVKQDSATGNDIITSNYTYKLGNTEKNSTLTRFLSYNTVRTTKDNGQIIEQSGLNARYTEVVKVGDKSFNLKGYDYTSSNLIDRKPAVEYFAGNMWGRKTYESGNGDMGEKVTVEVTGDFYGYNQFWGSTETQILSYIIQGERKIDNYVDKWGGTANVSLALTTSKQIKYIENEPETISFEGGFVESQYNNSVLQYTSNLPEFDHKGVSTDKILTVKDSLKIESFPNNKRLPVQDLKHIKGHWAESDIKALYSLEVFKENPSGVNPQQVMNRGEFADAIVRAAKEVPQDPAITNKTRAKKTTREELVSPFIDVPTGFKYFDTINSAFTRNIISGKGNGRFAPEDNLIMADAITVIIRAMGLEGLSPVGGGIINFKDSDEIPGYAREHVYAAQRIGLILGDDMGYLKPVEYLTKARGAVIINKFINYMRNDLKRDYRERIINY